MGSLENHLPAAAMLGLQLIYAIMTISSRAALEDGMSPMVFVVYRQAIGTVVLAPIAYFANRKNGNATALGPKSFCLLFIASLVGVTINEILSYLGLYLSSSATASALGNLVPAITFIMATSIGLEKVDWRSPRSLAKIYGTFFCVGGAVLMALFKGPTLKGLWQSGFNGVSYGFHKELLGGENWMMGCLLLFLSNSCWSFWMILQVPLSASYPNHLALSAWMCFLGTIQSTVVTLFLEDKKAWKLNSAFDFFVCANAGVINSGLAFYVQTWCISRKGPFFTSMFSPLCTVLVNILACTFLHEELYLGSMGGAILVMGGVYVVLWGKAKDLDIQRAVSPICDFTSIQVSIDDLHNLIHELKEPLLLEKHVTDNIEVKK